MAAFSAGQYLLNEMLKAKIVKNVGDSNHGKRKPCRPKEKRHTVQRRNCRWWDSKYQISSHPIDRTKVMMSTITPPEGTGKRVFFRKIELPIYLRNKISLFIQTDGKSVLKIFCSSVRTWLAGGELLTSWRTHYNVLNPIVVHCILPFSSMLRVGKSNNRRSGRHHDVLFQKVCKSYAVVCASDAMHANAPCNTF